MTNHLTEQERHDVAKMTPEAAGRLAQRLDEMVTVATNECSKSPGDLPWAVQMYGLLSERASESQ